MGCDGPGLRTTLNQYGRLELVDSCVALRCMALHFIALHCMCARQLMEAMQTGLYTAAELLAADEANAAGGAQAGDNGRSQLLVKPMRSVRVDGGMCRSDLLMQMQADITNCNIGAAHTHPIPDLPSHAFEYQEN